MIHPLEGKLRDAGIACRVETRDRLVILIPDRERVAFQREDRLRALRIARDEAFSHVAIELDPLAALSRD